MAKIETHTKRELSLMEIAEEAHTVMIAAKNAAMQAFEKANEFAIAAHEAEESERAAWAAVERHAKRMMAAE